MLHANATGRFLSTEEFTKLDQAYCKISYIQGMCLRYTNMKENQLSALFRLVIAIYYIANSGVLATCDPTSGPAGTTHCIKIDRYYGYQWATCRTDTYIQTKSNNKHQCIDRTRIYCYYQCMLDVYIKNFGNILPHCKCSPYDAVPTESVTLPAWCYSPDGKTCNWYRQCLNKAYPQCENDDDDYAIKFAEKFCKLYDESYSEFSSQGQRWIDAVRKCLQLKLVPLVDRTRDKSCADLKSTAFGSHTPCYLNPDQSSLSYCDLSLADQGKVFWTIKSSFFYATVPSLNGLLEVMTNCSATAVRSFVYNTKAKINKAVERIADQATKAEDSIFEETKIRIKTWLEDTVSPIPIQLDLLVQSDYLKYHKRRKRSLGIDDDNSRTKFAGEVLDDVAMEENWKDKGVTWFGYAKSKYARKDNTMWIRLVVADRYKYDTSLPQIKVANLTTTLVELSEAVVNGTLNLIVDGERVIIIQLNGCLDWNCKEHAFSVEGNGAVMYGVMYTLSLAYFVINILFVS